MKRHAHIVFLCLLLCVTAGIANANEEIGRVIALQGSAIAKTQDGTHRTLAIRDVIHLYDTVITASETKMQLLLKDESVISLGEDSEMTIDEYVYAPEKAKDNSTSMSMVRGVFRVITGKITKLNPDRFRVRTSMATIGIRGCDVGFRVTSDKQDFYIIHLHGYESVVVEARPQVGGGEWQGLVDGTWSDPATARQHLINVLRPNRVVSIRSTGEMEEREIAPEELMALLNEVVPFQGDTDEGESGGDNDGEDTEENPQDGDNGEDQENGENPQDGADDEGDTGADDGDLSDSGDTDTPADGDMPSDDSGDTDDSGDWGDGDQDGEWSGDDFSLLDPDDGQQDDGFDDGDVLDDPVDDTFDIGSNPDTLPDPELDDPTIGDDGTVDDGTVDGGGGTVDGGGGDDGGVQIADPVFTQKGAGDGWDWGLWEKDGLVDSIEFRALQPISVADFEALMNGTYLYNLQGNGVAAALIRHDGAKSLVEGTAGLFVKVGQGAMSDWEGTFDMQNASSDYLYFTVLNGIIQSDGKMTGNHDYYNMSVNGTLFDSGTITAESISGQLVGPGTGTTPISGAAGSFSFDHGGAAQVQGGFGSNLSEEF